MGVDLPWHPSEYVREEDREAVDSRLDDAQCHCQHRAWDHESQALKPELVADAILPGQQL